MDGWNTFSFPFGAFRPIFRGKLKAVSFREFLFSTVNFLREPIEEFAHDARSLDVGTWFAEEWKSLDGKPGAHHLDFVKGAEVKKGNLQKQSRSRERLLSLSF